MKSELKGESSLFLSAPLPLLVLPISTGAREAVRKREQKLLDPRRQHDTCTQAHMSTSDTLFLSMYTTRPALLCLSLSCRPACHGLQICNHDHGTKFPGSERGTENKESFHFPFPSLSLFLFLLPTHNRRKPAALRPLLLFNCTVQYTELHLSTGVPGRVVLMNGTYTCRITFSLALLSPSLFPQLFSSSCCSIHCDILEFAHVCSIIAK